MQCIILYICRINKFFWCKNKFLFNINSVQVELKQWLYNHGDQCLHNTGGWMTCKESNTGRTYIDIVNGNPNAESIASSSVIFFDDKIIYECSMKVTIGYLNNPSRYYRAASTAAATIGTKSPLTKDVNLYKKIMVSDNSKGIVATFRIGVANDANTQINTATILQSLTASDMNIAMNSSNPYLVIGNYIAVGKYEGWPYKLDNLTEIHDCEISEIWLE